MPSNQPSMAAPGAARARSYLFVPGDSERKIEKALGSEADALIFDLEDSVVAERKAMARENVRRVLQEKAHDEAPELWVRINALSTASALTDIAAAAAPGLQGIVLPKLESPDELKRLDEALSAQEARARLTPGSVRVFAITFETPKALLNHAQLAGPFARLTAMSWGGEDLALALGARSNREPDGTLSFDYRIARSLCLVAAKAAGVSAIETIWPNYRDHAGLMQAATTAYRDGFTGMLAVHPSQAAVINAAFTPSDEDIAFACRVIAAFEAQPGAGAVGLDGRMLDVLHLERARALLAASALGRKSRQDT